jgi:hypothetical protein
MLVASFGYAATVYYSYVTYVNPTWEYMGFTFRMPGASEIFLSLLLVAGVALFLPLRLMQPSALLLVLLFIVVYVPGIVITFCLDADRISRYSPFAVAMAGVFIAASLATVSGERRLRGVTRSPSRNFYATVLCAWSIVCTVLVFEYHDVMQFAALDDVYEQRALGASSSALMGYMQTYFSHVLSPALMALGLVYRRFLFVLLGLCGSVLMYMVNAQKTILLLPLAMLLLQAHLSTRFNVLRGAWVMVAAVAGVVAFAASSWEHSVTADALALFFVNRTIAVPGLTLSQYYDQFSAEGFTFWSHVKGLDLVISAPVTYSSDPLWPGIGYMLGHRVFGNPEFNMNANLFSGDGIAAAGTIGVVLIGMIFILFLITLDRITARWDSSFVLLALLPVAIALTNGHFFTTLLSFGGIFWMLAFAVMRGEIPVSAKLSMVSTKSQA